MSTIAIAITVTYTGFSKTTLPPAASDRTATARSMAATDKAITDLAEYTRQKVVQEFLGIDSNANTNTTVAVTVT